ncbi:SDR family NAD(P)-dependent oxidoreductase [Oceaniglobus trochenteri]|uniref:SDR family NAD(P)-dependent oxidoreductase n=1 Tax=Oceaniglobus trochenteri TaxID=2763260 RepID=UPI001CFF79DC
MTQSRPFENRRILVTGASRGIAAEIALALGQGGAHVIVNHSAAADDAAGRGDAAQTLASRIAGAGGSAELIEQNLEDTGAGRTLAQKARAGGPVDSVVLSASIQIHKPFLCQSSDDIARQIAINITTNLELLQQLLPDMVSAGFGRVLAIGSVQQQVPSAEMPIYAMTKAALVNLFENLALQGGADGITFNTLSPGLVQTDRNAFRRRDMATWEKACKGANPMQRAGQPAEMAAPALYFLSRDAGFVTGATLFATGGSHIRSFTSDARHGFVLPDATDDSPH